MPEICWLGLDERARLLDRSGWTTVLGLLDRSGRGVGGSLRGNEVNRGYPLCTREWSPRTSMDKG